MTPPRPKLIAHRGASGYAPENTLAAFQLALDMGAQAIEFDVQQSKDGRLVVIHDLDLKRVAGLRRRVGAMTYRELSQLDVGSWFGARHRGERIPLLEEVLDLAAGQAELHLEVKNEAHPYPGIEERVVKLLRARREWDGRVVISSFNHETLYLVRALDGSARIGYLLGVTRRGVALQEVAKLGCESVHMSLGQADRAWADALRRQGGAKLLVYTVNEPKEYERLRALGVDAVFTNFPDLLDRRQ